MVPLERFVYTKGEESLRISAGSSYTPREVRNFEVKRDLVQEFVILEIIANSFYKSTCRKTTAQLSHPRTNRFDNNEMNQEIFFLYFNLFKSPFQNLLKQDFEINTQ